MPNNYDLHPALNKDKCFEKSPDSTPSDRTLARIQIYNQPQNFAQWLCYSRTKFVVQAARETYGKFYPSYYQRAIQIAAEQAGLGIQVSDLGDPDRDRKPNRELRELQVAFQTKFEERFTPYTLASLLVGDLRDLAKKMGYDGFREDGYEIAFRQSMTAMISRLLPGLKLDLNDPESWKKIFTSCSRKGEEGQDQDTGVSDSRVCQDLDWNSIRGAAHRALLANGYIEAGSLSPRNLLDYLDRQTLRDSTDLQSSELGHGVLPEEEYIEKFNSQDQYKQLALIYERHPTYLEHLSKQLDFSSRIEEVTTYLRATFEIATHRPDWDHLEDAGPTPVEKKKATRCALIVFITIFNTDKQPGPKIIKELNRIFLERYSSRWGAHTLLSFALWHTLNNDPTLLLKTLEAMGQHKHYWSSEQLSLMLLGSTTVTTHARALRHNIFHRVVEHGDSPLLEKFLLLLGQTNENKLSSPLEITPITPIRTLFLSPRTIDTKSCGPEAAPYGTANSLVDYIVQSPHLKAEILKQILDFMIARTDIFGPDDLSNTVRSLDHVVLKSDPEKLKLVFSCLSSNEARFSPVTVRFLCPDVQKMPSSDKRSKWQWLLEQWSSLLKCAEADQTRSDLLVAPVLEYERKHRKLPEAIKQLLIDFVLRQLSHFDFSDRGQQERFLKILDLMHEEDTSPLLQRLQMDESIQTQCTKNLPTLLAKLLLPQYLHTLEQECKTLQEKLQARPGLFQRASRFFTAALGPDDQSKLHQLRQENTFVQSWTQAIAGLLTQPESPQYRSDLSALAENLDANMRSLLCEKRLLPLFERSYQEMFPVPLEPFVSTHSGPRM